MTPRLMFCAPASGSGKTTVTCAVLRALLRRGLRPMACKSGPDYIDPMFHSRVLGAQSCNLDLFFFDHATARGLLARYAGKADVTVLEGAMGYYDGIAMGTDASAYALATATQTPAVLVVDGRGRALSAAAEVLGFQRFRQPSGIAGVIVNRVSPMVYPRLAETITRETGLPVFGFLPVMAESALESRHLGLVTAAELEQSPVSLPVVPDRPRIAVARDKAFCFYYEASLQLLRELGAELVAFSPMRDERLPRQIQGLYLGGGYPELYARELAENETMRQSIHDAVTDGMPTVAECGGFLYLHRTLRDEAGTPWPMAGVLAADGYPTGKLSRFGYVTLTAETDSLLFRRGETMPAHEFHYWDSTQPGADFTARKPQSERHWMAGVATDSLYAGFPHFHFAAKPEAARRFVEAAAAYGKKQDT